MYLRAFFWDAFFENLLSLTLNLLQSIPEREPPFSPITYLFRFKFALMNLD